MMATEATRITCKNILVTRPKKQARELAEQIRAQGWNPILMPTLEIESVSLTDSEKQCMEQIEGFDLVFVTSQNAANVALDLLSEKLAELTANPNWIAIGPATQKTLSKYGLEAEVPKDTADSEHLLQMPQLNQLRGKRCLILKGIGGRKMLAENLRSRGALVFEVNLYRRCLPEYSAENIQKLIFLSGSYSLQAIVVTSVEALNNLITLLAAHLKWVYPTPLVAASARISMVAKKAGFENIFVAKGANSSSIIAAINVIG